MSPSSSSQGPARFRRPKPACLGVLLALTVLISSVSGQTAADAAGLRIIPLRVPASGKTGFTRLTPDQTGMSFTNALSQARYITNHVLLNGGGVALGDVDGDGWCDVYLCRSEGGNALYRNLGNGRFEDIAEAAGVACGPLRSTGAVLADLDGDGDLDLLVNTVGQGTHRFVNDGKGRFRAATEILNPNTAGMTFALADVDGDGFLDLYIANHRTSTLMDMGNARITLKKVGGRTELETFNGRPVTEPDLAHRFAYDPQNGLQERGEVHALYRNRGGDHFELVPFTEGAFLDEDGKPLAAPTRDWGLSAAFHDVNEDGLPDLYVCNDFLTEDRFWINQGKGRFRRIDRLAQRKSSMSSMAVDFADINRDGAVDFLVLDMMSRSHGERMRFQKAQTSSPFTPGLIDNRPQYELNTLFLNRGDTTFAEIAPLSGLEAAEWAWSCAFMDVDLDGWEDLLVVNGMEWAGRDLDTAEQIKRLRAGRTLSDREVLEARKLFPRQATSNLAFRNRRDLTFEEVAHAWGFDWAGVSSSMALADLDNDGDLDVVVNNLNDAVGVFRNESNAPRLAVRLNGLPPNTQGVGALVRVQAPGLPAQTKEVIAGGRYLSSDAAHLVFAAGSPADEVSVEVRWRSGRRSLFDGLRPNGLCIVEEAAASTNSPTPPAASEPPWFEEVTARLNHRHQDEVFDDFARQPLLPNRLSQLGPGLAWLDVNRDGWDDLIIGSGKGGRLGVFTNNLRGGFVRLGTPPFDRPVLRDQLAVVGWPKTPTNTVILASAANYEDGLALGVGVQQYDLSARSLDESLATRESSFGPLALADVDGDGDLDLFAGGRAIGGRYPEPASSVLFRNEQGRLVADEAASTLWRKIGLVVGAIFTDLDGDGDPDLVLACEWDAIRTFLNDQGRFREHRFPLTDAVDTQSGVTMLSQLTGWWTGVTAGDFDGDGRLDLMAGNWGRNTQYEAHRNRPLQLYYGHLSGGDGVDLVEAHFDAEMGKTVPERQLEPLSKALPFLREICPTHRAFGAASLDEILTHLTPSPQVLTAACLETTLLLNRGDHFERRPLPVEAQFAPVFGLCVADADGDGCEDVFLAQNFFATQPETPRYDAGRGLWLRGDGRGGFFAVPGQTSGVRVYGEQRAAALADFDGDGRVDLAVTQNGAETKLFRNRRAHPGIRVRLEDGPGNPQAIGACLRAVFGTRLGPVRELRAGGGYGSQDSPTAVLATPEAPTALWLRWPGGQVTQAELPAGATAVSLNRDTRVATPITASGSKQSR